MESGEREALLDGPLCEPSTMLRLSFHSAFSLQPYQALLPLPSCRCCRGAPVISLQRTKPSWLAVTQEAMAVKAPIASAADPAAWPMFRVLLVALIFGYLAYRYWKNRSVKQVSFDNLGVASM